ncbi:lysophospholipid acyltransferase family protein [Maribacter stanieri]|uniref:lysophospholipid acyltransferase family protein n=1 Tax=Maribacter stanieri TaxID=440514 RepID=UPI0030DD355E
MSGFIYSIVKVIVKTGLYGYHKKITISGLENIPVDKPVMFLPNHQSALMDVLLIATDCNRKPYFLTRSDVFKGKFLKRVFNYFQMLPIYRMRDGRGTLFNNDAIFNSCAEILNRREALLLFPEANHSLQRRVRPLSKGFTRILFRAFELYPDLDVQLIPVGFNYKNATHFPDEVSIYYGKPISAKRLFNAADLNSSSLTIKNKITSNLRQLTTHIPNEEQYDAINNRLINEKADFLNPIAINKKVKAYSKQHLGDSNEVVIPNQNTDFYKSVFSILNFPVVIVWRLWLKPKVPEDEFMGTFRFAFGLLSYPIYLVLLFILLSIFSTLSIALLITVVLTMINILLVKYALE